MTTDSDSDGDGDGQLPNVERATFVDHTHTQINIDTGGHARGMTSYVVDFALTQLAAQRAWHSC